MEPRARQGDAKAEGWFKAELKAAGLRDETPGKRLVGMHAFRSTFLNRAHKLRLCDYETITGHASTQRAVVRGYQWELDLQHKRDIVEQITFDIEVPRPAKPTR